MMSDMIIPTLGETDYSFPDQTSFYKGKVRDVYIIKDKFMVIVVSDRISAFDVVLPRQIPFKGQVLNQLAAYFLQATRDVCPNWLIEVPDPNVSVGILCEPYKVEMVVRGYLTGHAWREYKSGKRMLCGVKLPDGLKEFDRFEKPIITPTTKSHHGHDEDISRDEIIQKGLIPESEYVQLENYSLALFEKGTKLANDKKLILADTKYEFGKGHDKIFIIDEVHTPDSSRYFYKDDFQERIAKGIEPRQLSKEFLRQWLISKGFQGREDDVLPEMTDEIVKETGDRYIELYESITGKTFIKSEVIDIIGRIEDHVIPCIKGLLSGI